MSPGLSSAFADRARPVLNLIDDLRKTGIQQCVPIPQIAVMGDQSSGKSSVLEAISGIAFPRSAGLCTRCPTQVSMTHGDIWSASLRAGSGKEHILKAAESHLIAGLIEELTTELAGSKSEGGFSSNADYIEIKLVSPKVPDLTIIDLPGIVRTTTKGQSQEVKNQVDAMLDRFLQQERTIILAVIPSNVDIATVDILERATKVDPDGKRTIGVLTKPDLVDKGAEPQVIEVVSNRTKPLLHGYFMVKNRSQKELDDSECPNVARELERAWLASSKYASIAGISDTRLGVRALTTALTELLVDRIVEVIPSMTLEVERNLKEATSELESLGKPPPSSASECRALAGDLIRDFCRSLRKTCSEASPVAVGTSQESEGVLQQERRLRKKFMVKVAKSRPGFDGELDKFDVKVVKVSSGYGQNSDVQVGQILTGVSWTTPESITKIGSGFFDNSQYGDMEGQVVAIRTYFRGSIANRMEERKGRELPGFMSFPIFKDLISEYVERWKEPTDEFQIGVCTAMTEAAGTIVSLIAKEYPRLVQMMKDDLLTHFGRTQLVTSSRLAKQLSLEKMPSTENLYLWETINKIRDDRMFERLEALATNDSISVECARMLLKSDIGNSTNESQEVQDMIDILKAYWQLASKRYIDDVGMIVSDAYTSSRHMDVIEKRLTRAAVLNLDDATIQRLFEPNRMTEKRRAELQKRVKSMRQARKRLQEGI